MTEIVCDGCGYRQQYPFERLEGTPIPAELEKQLLAEGWTVGITCLCPKCMEEWRDQQKQRLKEVRHRLGVLLHHQSRHPDGYFEKGWPKKYLTPEEQAEWESLKEEERQLTKEQL